MPPSSEPILGRWDMTLNHSDGDYPMWLEVHHSGSRTLVGQFVAAHGSARPISQVEVSGSRFRFAIPPQWEPGDGDFIVEGELQNDKMSGSATFPNGQSFPWTANRAPALRRAAPTAWGEPVSLFNGTDLSGWHVVGGENNWVVEDGILKCLKPGGNLISTRLFDDFKLHVEFRLPERGNSGVYLRGRYEIQILDDPRTEPASDLIGGIYGFIAPSEIVTKGAGAWNAFDVTLIGRMVTVVVNGQTVICNQEIPGITGGALDSDEAAPGPIYLQGDHTAIEYRNILVTQSAAL
jgi:hypothetical protein